MDANGTERRRKTWPAAISFGELQASLDPEISEWENLISVEDIVLTVNS